MLRSFSTKNVPNHSKMAYWNSLHCDLRTPMNIEPGDRRSFEAEFTLGMIGPASIAEHVSLPVTIERTTAHVAQTKEHMFFINLMTEGRSHFTHFGHEILLGAGDFTIASTACPGRFVTDDNNRTISMAIPADLVRRHLPFVDEICGLHMPGERGLSHVVSGMVVSIWREAQAGFPAHAGLNALKALLDMLAASYEACYEIEGFEQRVHSRISEIKKFIEAHLREHDLCPKAIADNFDISTRYVHTIFSKQGETVSSYILRRRIEECAHELAGNPLNSRTITDIAFDWGFNNTAHFTRVFKQHLGLSPRDYRKQSLPASSIPGLLDSHISASKVAVPS